MTDSNSVFLDTSPIIYLIENHPLHYSKTAAYLADTINQDILLITSVISIAEFGVKPKKTNNHELLDEMENMLAVLHVNVVDINRSMAEISSTLRAKYLSLKNFDALQIACAINYGCKRFLTNDIQLKKIKELEVILIDEL